MAKNIWNYFVVGLKGLGVSLLSGIPLALLIWIVRAIIDSVAVQTAISIIAIPLYLMAWGYVANKLLWNWK